MSGRLRGGVGYDQLVRHWMLQMQSVLFGLFQLVNSTDWQLRQALSIKSITKLNGGLRCLFKAVSTCYILFSSNIVNFCSKKAFSGKFLLLCLWVHFSTLFCVLAVHYSRNHLCATLLTPINKPFTRLYVLRKSWSLLTALLSVFVRAILWVGNSLFY